MELEFNLERTLLSPTHNHWGIEIWQVEFSSLWLRMSFSSSTFLHLSLPGGTGGRERARDIEEEAKDRNWEREKERGEKWSGSLNVSSEHDWRRTLRNWLPAGQTTPLFSSFFISICSPCEMEHTHAQIHTLTCASHQVFYTLKLEEVFLLCECFFFGR